jgi:malate synthase
MGKLKGRKLQDLEFAAVPARIENYEVAEKTAKLITKLSNKRVELAEKYPETLKVANDYMFQKGFVENGNSVTVHAPILLKMKEYFAGFVYYAAGKFHPSESMKYKMINKALGIWDTFSKSDLSSIPEIHVELV